MVKGKKSGRKSKTPGGKSECGQKGLMRRQVYILIAFLILLVGLVYLDNGGFEGMVTKITGNFIYENEVWEIPCNSIGAFDFVEEILIENYQGINYCGQAGSGEWLPGNNYAEMSGCGFAGNFANIGEWINDCNRQYGLLT